MRVEMVAFLHTWFVLRVKMNCADVWPTWKDTIPVVVTKTLDSDGTLVPTGYTAVQVTLAATRATLRPTEMLADSTGPSIRVTGEVVVKATTPPG